MSDSISSIHLEYGDARLRFYSILKTGKNSNSYYPHQHFFYELHLAVKGSYLYSINGREVRLSERELLIIPPGTVHESVDFYGLNYNAAVLSVSLEKAEGKSGFYDCFKTALDKNAVTPIKVSKALREQITDFINDGVCDSIRDYCVGKAKASRILCELFENLNGFGRISGMRSVPSDREESLALLESLVNSSRPLYEIAAKINYSERHTSRLIRKKYGMSLTQLYKKRKNS